MIKKALFKLLNFALEFHKEMGYKNYRERYNISPSFRFNGDKILLYGDGNIVLGHRSYIGYLSTLNSVQERKIQIGNYCHISHNVRIYTRTPIANQNFINAQDQIIKKEGDVIIGDGVWIGVNVYIGPDVIIGDNAVIGANSVVTKNIEANSINIGNPVRLVKIKDFRRS